MSSPTYPSYYSGAFAPPPAPEKKVDPAAERGDRQARTADEGARPKLPPERMIHASCIVSVQTSRRIEFPCFVRRVDEGPAEFAERVKKALIELQGGV